MVVLRCGARHVFPRTIPEFTPSIAPSKGPAPRGRGLRTLGLGSWTCFAFLDHLRANLEGLQRPRARASSTKFGDLRLPDRALDHQICHMQLTIELRKLVLAFGAVRDLHNLLWVDNDGRVEVQFRAMRELAAFDRQRPELTDGYSVEWILNSSPKKARPLVPSARICRHCFTWITICSNWSIPFVRVLFVMVSLRLQVTRAANMKTFNQIWQKSDFRMTDFSETLRKSLWRCCRRKQHGILSASSRKPVHEHGGVCGQNGANDFPSFGVLRSAMNQPCSLPTSSKHRLAFSTKKRVMGASYSCTRFACSSDPNLPTSPSSTSPTLPSKAQHPRCLPTERLLACSCPSKASTGLRTRALKWHRVESP